MPFSFYLIEEIQLNLSFLANEQKISYCQLIGETQVDEQWSI